MKNLANFNKKMATGPLKTSGPQTRGIGLSITLEGAAALEKKLNLLDAKVSRKIVSRALRAGAKVILDKAKQLAPRGKSGKLYKSLKVRAGKRKKGVIRFVVQTKDGDFKGETFYGAFIEFGHKAGSRKLGNSRKSIPAKPYLGPAFDSKKDEALDIMLGVIRHELLAIV